MKNKINVNMTPNPLDLQTLHCSQGDTSERKFQFTLHNQGEVYDLEDISDPVFTSFPVEVGGTEELQPVNGTSPSTSPIIADITYPDGLREGEEFTYRESPTTISGNANIKALYGNTIVWNQLHTRITEASQTVTKNGVSVTSTRSGTVTTYTASGTVANASGDNNYYLTVQTVNVTSGRKYFVSSSSMYFFLNGYNAGTLPANQQSSIWTATTTGTMAFAIKPIASTFVDGTVINETFYVMFIDLTQMFGSGNEPTSVSDFTSLFSLPFYPYDSGSLLSFNGTGIKTVGFNQWDEEWELGSLSTSTGDVMADNGIIRSKNYISVLPSTDYYFLTSNINSYLFYYDGNKNYIGFADPSANRINTIPSNCFYVKMRIGSNARPQTTYNNDICLNISNPSKNGTYEPYTSSTTSLPTLTYFPTGMKSAGNVYDELTASKAITRVGTRAYQSGDESDTSVTTDGTNTNYALATEVVQSIMSASLITENGEAPLYHNGECLECECNEDISSEPGFHVAKIKFTYDDGTNYSNKIELHVERSPQ